MGEFVNFLKQSDLFFNLTQAQQEMVETLCTERVFQNGEVILEENARDDELCLIISGEVQVLLNPALVASQGSGATEPVVISTLRRGQSFGEVALVDEGVRSATVRAAAGDTRVLVIGRKKLLLLCSSYPELGYQVMFNVAADLSTKIRNAGLRIREEVLYRQGGRTA